MSQSHSSGEKTEQPTPRMQQEARRRGEVALSRDLTSSILLLAAVVAIVGCAHRVLETFGDMAVQAFGQIAADKLDQNVLLAVLATSGQRAALLLLPLFGVLLLLAAFLPFIQIGPVLTFETIKPQLAKLNPINGLKERMFSLRAYVQLFQAILKIGIAGALCAQVIGARLSDIIAVAEHSCSDILVVAGIVLQQCAVRVILFMLALSVLDVAYQRWQYRLKHRVTKQEKKEAFKQDYGDPRFKHRRQQMHREIAASTMLSAIRDADVVVTNPTHLACGLRFDPDQEAEAPRLIGKGEDHLAARIRAIAREEGIPIVRDVRLARALYELETEDLVPETLYDAVGEVLRWVETIMRSRGELPRWAAPHNA